MLDCALRPIGIDAQIRLGLRRACLCHFHSGSAVRGVRHDIPRHAERGHGVHKLVQRTRGYEVGLPGSNGKGLVTHTGVSEALAEGGVVVNAIIDLWGGGREGGREGWREGERGRGKAIGGALWQCSSSY